MLKSTTLPVALPTELPTELPDNSVTIDIGETR